MTIQITPRTFGNIAAEAMRYGLDVSAYLIRRTLGVLPDDPATTPTGESSTATATATPAPEPEATTPLPTGMGLTARVAWLEGQRTNNNH